MRGLRAKCGQSRFKGARMEKFTDPSGKMAGRIIEFDKLKKRGIPLMFIDSILPGHQRMNYALIGDTASEDDKFEPYITSPHGFQLGMAKAPPGNGPAYHTHDYIEAFLPLTGKWRFRWGEDPDAEPDGEAILEPWDLISLPPKLWRSFENVSSEDAWFFAVLEQHEVFGGKDPYWASSVVKEAQKHGFHADDKGRMIKPENFEALEREMREKLEG